jgi:hypothetical protein
LNIGGFHFVGEGFKLHFCVYYHPWEIISTEINISSNVWFFKRYGFYYMTMKILDLDEE